MKFKKWLFSETMMTEPPLGEIVKLINSGGKIIADLSRYGYAEAVLAKGTPKMYALDKSSAEHGYGPFLHDLVIEEVSKNGGYTVSDRRSVTLEEKSIWE